MIWDLANYFATEPMLKILASGTKKPLSGLKVASYYGCMASRPPEITGATDSENPQSIDRIVKALGATPIDFPYKTDCCGASLMISRPDIGFKLVAKLLDMVKPIGAEAVIVSCQ